MNPIFDHTLPLEERLNHLLSELTIDEKISLLATAQPGIERLGIKPFQMCTEGAHGLLVRKHLEQWPSGISTVFPQPIGLSCTWDKDLLNRVGDVIGNEARIWYELDGHVQWLTIWSPTIDMERDPRWGRNEEAYGEDPFLAGKLSAAFIRGIQGDHPHCWKATSAPKHFYGNNMEKDRASTSTNVGERVKHEYYLRVFEYAFREGKAHSIMAAYNEVNGVPCLINPENVDLVVNKWGCDGYIVSDGGDLPQMVTEHHYCETHAEGIALALKAGADCFPQAEEGFIDKAAREALEQGILTETDLDRAVGNTLRTRFRLGMFDPDSANPYTSIKKEQLCGEEHTSVAREASRKSVVLLKNDGILPLDPSTCGKVLVIGDLAERNMPDWYSGKPPSAVSPLDAMKEIIPTGEGKKKPSIDTIDMHDLCVIFSSKHKAWLRVDEEGVVHYDGDEDNRTVFEEIDWGFNAVSYRHVKTGKYLNVTGDIKLGCTSEYVWGWFTMEQFFRSEATGKFMPHSSSFSTRYSDEEKKEIDNLTKGLMVETITNAMAPIANAAKKSDTVVIMLGNHPLINGREGFDRPSIELPKRWKKLLNTVYEVNKNVVLVLIAGYPYAFPKEEKLAKAILYASHGEQFVGDAIAKTLFGQYNPGGRLSQTWYLSEKDLPPMDNYDIINYPRTYLYFNKPVQYPFGYGLSYTTFDYSDISVTPDGDGYSVSCKVENTGDVAGEEVVQLYAVLGDVPVKAPRKKLCGFERIALDAGETKTVTFAIPTEEVRLYDEEKAAFSIVPGWIKFMVGASSMDLRLEVKV